MAFFSRGDGKKLDIEEVEGGWLLTWSDPSIDEDEDRERYSQMWPPIGKRRRSSGKQIFTDKKKLIKRLQDFL